MQQLVNMHRDFAPGALQGKRQRPKENSAPLPLTLASFRLTVRACHCPPCITTTDTRRLSVSVWASQERAAHREHWECRVSAVASAVSVLRLSSQPCGSSGEARYMDSRSP